MDELLGVSVDVAIGVTRSFNYYWLAYRPWVIVTLVILIILFIILLRKKA